MKPALGIAIFLCLLTIVLGFLLFGKHREGFAVSSDTPKCPDNYKFFTDARGDSLCCNGSIDAYKHKCNGGFCAFKRGMKNPALPGGVVPFCADLIAKSNANAVIQQCPSVYKHYANVGKCCFSGTDLDGKDCDPVDNKEKTYCRVSGTLAAGEQWCSAMRMFENAKCPEGLYKTSYTLGAKEIAKYGEKAKNRNIPICTGIENTCIPGATLDALQSDGIYKGKAKAAWKYSCDNWETVNIRRDTTGTTDASYL